MRTIHKYPINITPGIQVIKSYSLCKPLSFQIQHRQPFLWVEVNTAMPEKDLRIEVFGTGHELPFQNDNPWHIGTIIDSNFMVWHLYQYL